MTLPSTGITCIVGGNNAGKSQLLKELERYATTSRDSLTPIVSTSVQVERPSGSVEETRTWLENRFTRLEVAPGREHMYASSIGETGQSASAIHGWFANVRQGNAYLGNAAKFFVRRVSAGTLAAAAAGSLGSYSNSENAPIARLYRNGDLEDALDSATRDTFGLGVVVDRVDVNISIRVGSIDVPIPPINRPTAEYTEAVGRLPLLDTQGDGLRSFVGLAIQLLADRPNVLLVDEPEAFLHPGQARAVGRWLAIHARLADVQLVVATHDRDLVLGLLSAEGSEVAIVRLNRDGAVNHLTQLSPEVMRSVWNDPSLRYSNVLQGLFHQRVVICESDGDCRFFGAALDEYAIGENRRAEADDVLFVPAGGKNRVGSMANALVKIGVPALALFDFDVLRKKADLRGAVEGVGANWSDTMNDCYRVFADAVNGGATSWEVLKSTGLSAVPRGAPYEALLQLLDLLSECRVHVLEVGEIEDFSRAIPLEKSAWVSQALEEGVHRTDPVRDVVRRFLAEV